MRVALINLPLVGQVGDYLSMLPHQPVGLLYVAAALRKAGHDVDLIDCFGEAPGRYIEVGSLAIEGLYGAALLLRIPRDVGIVGVSCSTGLHHHLATALIAALRERDEVPIVVAGAQATLIPGDFIAAGADFVIRGEGERSMVALVESLGAPDKLGDVPGLVGRGFAGPPFELIDDLDDLPLPAFDLLRLASYWDLGDAHGPFNGPYLDIFTSRGCPYDCRFCAGPALCRRRWRGRSAKSVVDEMELRHRELLVCDFHIQDPNFAVSAPRVRAFVSELLARKLPIRYSLPTGIHVEHLELDDLDLLAASGLTYVSFAPESGSARVRELMNKPADIARLQAFVERCRRLGIRTSASFIIGFPGEEDLDRQETLALARDLIERGLDEFPVFIFCPVPGSEAEGSLELPDYSSMTSSPTWRTDFFELRSWRKRIMAAGLAAKLRSRPGAFLEHALRIAAGRYAVKSEMAVRRAIRLEVRGLRSKLRRALGVGKR